MCTLYKHNSEMTSLFFFKIKNYFLLLKMPQMIKIKYIDGRKHDLTFVSINFASHQVAVASAELVKKENSNFFCEFSEKFSLNLLELAVK